MKIHKNNKNLKNKKMSKNNSSENENDYIYNNNINEEESVDEEYIEPIDLSIIEDELNWKPTEEQLNGYMNQLNFGLDYKPEEIKK